MIRSLRHIVLLALGLLLSRNSLAQNSVYAFLERPMSARLNALGGMNVTMMEPVVSNALQNPALLNADNHQMLDLTYSLYLNDCHSGSVIYGHTFRDNYIAAGIHYYSYGRMQYATENGVLDGSTFSAQDLSFNLMYARRINDYITIGATIKPICSFYESYSSIALAADMGIHVRTKDRNFQAGLSIQNIGMQLKKFYYDAEREKLPLNIVLGWHYRFAHAPLRISMTIHNLQKWDLNYQTTNIDGYKSVPWYDMMFRHTVFALDIVPRSDRFYLTVSYNHRLRQEMTVSDVASAAGFGFGAGLRVKMVHLDAAFAQYQKGIYSFQFSISLNINSLLDRKKVPVSQPEIISHIDSVE